MRRTQRITSQQRREQLLVATALLRYIEEDAEGFRILARDASVGSDRGSFASVLVDVADTAEELPVQSLRAGGMPVEHAPIYARMLVGAFALLGEWWLDTREHPGEVVAAHAVNLLWNGLAGLEPAPVMPVVPTPEGGTAAPPPPRSPAATTQS